MQFEEYVVARRTALVRSAVLLGCARPDAEDLVQSTLLRCYRSWRRVQRADNPDAYVYRVLVNTLRDAAVRHWNREVPTEMTAAHDRPATEPDLLAGIAVRRALAVMSPEHREVLVLRYYADLSERATSEVLGIAPGTVKSRTSRALAALAADENVRTPDAC